MRHFLKRSLSLLLAITIIFGSAYVGLSEVDFGGLFVVKAQAVTGGICGDNVKWSFDDEGTLTISGTGNMGNYSGSGPSFCDLSVKNVIIEDGVTSIGSYMFYELSELVTITIPDSVTSIGACAFYCCTSLASITIPDSVTSIGDYAFYGCTSLTSIIIPDSVTSIGERAFAFCDKLTSATIGNSVDQIGLYAFLGCDSLSSLTLGNSITSIKSYAFNDCESLEYVFYTGTEEQWENIIIGAENTELTSASIHYEATDHIYDYDSYEYVQNPEDADEYVKQYKCTYCDVTTLGEEVYLPIKTADDFKNIGNSLSANYVLLNDINLGSEEFTPFADEFSGVFDGNNHTIEGVYLTLESKVAYNYSFPGAGGSTLGTSGYFVGLFPRVTGTIKNLNIDGAVELGLVESSNKNKYFGALVGVLYGGNIENCHSSADFTFSAEGYSAYGSIAGVILNGATVKGCSNTGNIKDTLTDNSRVGGIVGYLNDNSNIYQCFNTGDLSGRFVGGIVGMCHSTNSFVVSDCYSTGNLSGSTVGGIAGYYIDYCLEDFLTVNNCYSVGKVNQGAYADTYIGSYTSSYKPDATGFYVSSTSGITGTGVTSDEDMRLQATYVDYDFDAIWFMDDSNGYPYPQLRNNPHRSDVCEHIYSDWITDTEATCETDGTKHRTCSSCGNIENETIAATGHTVGEWVVTTEPTCSTEGVKTGYCSVCGAECATEAVPTTEHNYDESSYEYVQNPENADEYIKQKECIDCGAKGSDEDPYIAIDSIDELYQVSNNLSKNYILMADIDATEATSSTGGWSYEGYGWDPIGTNTDGFSGTFDGNGHSIIGLRITKNVPNEAVSNCKYYGLFAVNNGIIKNLKLVNVDISGSYYHREQVSSSYTSTPIGYAYVGAICGKNAGVVQNCSVSGIISTVSRYSWGKGNSSLSGVYYTFSKGVGYAGGIAGENEGAISRCYNQATITCSDIYVDGTAASPTYYSSSLGGIVGCAADGSTVSECFNVGEFDGTHSFGDYSYGSGIVGKNNGADTVVNCYSTTQEKGLSESTIVTSYYKLADGGVYYDATGASYSLTDTQMKFESMFSGFDFENIWIIDATTVYKYPQLRNARQTTEVVPETIELTTLPKTEYFVGDVISVEGGDLKVNYLDGTTETIALTDNMLSTVDMSTVGTKTVTVIYKGVTTSFDITVNENYAKNIIIESLPDNTSYIEGQEIDITGLVVKAEFANGTVEYITDYEISYDNSVAGEQTVTISCGDATATFTVTFTAKTLVSIAVTKMPDKTVYVEGEGFDNTGMVVTATYDNGLSEEVTGYTVSTLPKTPGTKTLIVTYSGKRVTIQVTVVEKEAVSMTVVEPEKFEYVLGEEFDPTGMVVTVTFNNGTTEEVTDYTIEGFGDFFGVGYVTLKYDELTYEFIILMHSPADSWVIETQATCTEDGVKHLYCTECGEIAKTEVIFATGHDYIETITKEATCLEKGVKQFNCQYCNSSYTEDFGGAHIISGEKVTIEPSCAADGEKYNLCSVCDEIVGDPIVIDALGHDYSEEFTIDIEATCLQEGSKSRHCSRCEAKTDVTAIESLVHNYSDWVVTTAATCESEGERTRSCSVCSESFTEPIEALGHVYSVLWTTDKTPTCTVDGSKSHHCNRCNAKTDVTVIAATGHSFGEWQILENTTCTVNGKQYRICSSCYSEEVETITAPGHSYGEWIIDSVADCENDGARHAVCSVCNTETEETIKAYGHDYESVFTVDKEATCTESGLKSHHCSRCESKTDETVIIALGHHISTMWTIDTEPTCESEGSKSHHCLRCDVISDVTAIPVASHIYGKWYIVTPATMDTAGVRAHKCYNCDMTEEAELPKLLKYTATFVADGDVVATVDFPEDATEIEIPEVPHKDKYNGEWENFDVRNKSFTVNAVYTPVSTDDIDGITAGNTADYYSSTGEVEINLHASAPGKTIVTTTTKLVPLDIVFVLDQSGSMADGGKKDALKNAVNSFSNEILADAKANSVDHRIAIVGFASGGNDNLNYQNTELLTADAVKYNKLSDDDYKNALVSVNDNGALNSIITKAVKAIDAEGATKADLGLEMASNIFANNPATDNRQRVVVFLTDGVPTSYSTFEYGVANAAIQNAYQLKNTYDATVYSVGVFDEETSANISVNNFMNYVSSNYNEEKVLKKNSNEASENTNGYYLDVTDASILSDVFTSIVEETVTHTGMFTNATLKYTLSQYFTLTSVQEKALRKSAIEALGVANDEILIARNADGTTTIVISNIEPWAEGENQVIDFTFRATANENTLKSGTYQVGTYDSGVILKNGEGFEAVFAPQSVDVGGTSGIAVFNINSIPYAFERLSSTTMVTAPATDFGADHSFIGWSVPANLTLNNEVRVFDAELSKNVYKISWNIDGEIIEASYAIGDFITIPQVSNNSIGGAFVGWDKVIPETMPSENLTITAIYDAHYHRYDVSKTFETCVLGGTLTYICECGDTYTEEIAPAEHTWEAITGATNHKHQHNVGFRCSVCGVQNDNDLELERVDEKENADNSHNTATYEFNYVDENGEKQQPEGDVEISVQLDDVFEGDIPDDANASIYRINDDGSRTKLDCEQNGMNMKFTTDHFSTYEFEFTTGEQKYIFAQQGTDIDYDNKLIFSDTYIAKEFKNLVTYLAPASISTETNGNGYFGTGTSISLVNGEFTDDYKVIINGDTNGDSVCDALDAWQVAKVSNGHEDLDGAYALAADSNEDENVDIYDYQAIVNKAVS